MGPIILVDKSFLQGLSHIEIDFLYKHYTIVITPILIMEILGDLSKFQEESDSRNEVKTLSKKILTFDSHVNTHYHKLCVASLLGIKVPMTGQILVDGGQEVQTETGEKGIFIDEPPEMNIIRNWKTGNFSDEEISAASEWRKMIDSIDLESYRDFYNKYYRDTLSHVTSLDELNSLIDSFCADSNIDVQYSILSFELDKLHLSQRLKDRIYNRWLSGNLKSFKDFAPYAFYCFKIDSLFNHGIICKLIGTRPTNKIDLRYLYYIPFCMVFCSGDNFHKQLSPYFMRSDQSFVERDILKNDLKDISEHWINLTPEEKVTWAENYNIYPPQKKGSICTVMVLT